MVAPVQAHVFKTAPDVRPHNFPEAEQVGGNGEVCYHNMAMAPDYGRMGHTEVLSAYPSIPSSENRARYRFEVVNVSVPEGKVGAFAKARPVLQRAKGQGLRANLQKVHSVHSVHSFRLTSMLQQSTLLAAQILRQPTLLRRTKPVHLSILAVAACECRILSSC